MSSVGAFRTFKPQQRFAFDWGRNRPRCAYAMQQRLGKSGVAIMEIAEPTVILCPAYLKLQWQEEIAEWRNDLRVLIVTPETTRAAAKGHDVFLVNYEIAQECYLPALPRVVFDEAHYLTGWESKRTLTALALADRAEYVRWLSGTMMPNRSMELWPFATAMRATRLPAHEWGIRYANGYMDQWGKWQYRGNTRTDEMSRLLEPYILRITREQTGMPENDWKVISLDLPVDVRERDYDLAAIAANPNVTNWEGLANLLHFQALGKLPLALAYVISLLRQGEGPMLVFGWHRDVLETFAKSVTAGGFRTELIVGGVSVAEKMRIKNAFQNGELDVVVANRKAAGVGLPLHMTERVVFIEAGWSPGENGQAADRGVSMERPRSLRVDLLTVFGSIDEHMVRRNLEKQGTIDRVIKPNEEFSTWLEHQQQATNPSPVHPNRLLGMPFARLRSHSAPAPTHSAPAPTCSTR